MTPNQGSSSLSRQSVDGGCFESRRPQNDCSSFAAALTVILFAHRVHIKIDLCCMFILRTTLGSTWLAGGAIHDLCGALVSPRRHLAQSFPNTLITLHLAHYLAELLCTVRVHCFHALQVRTEYSDSRAKGREENAAQSSCSWLPLISVKV